MGLLIVLIGLCQVTVDRTDGRKVSGDWISIEHDSVVIDGGNGPVSLPIEAVGRIRKDDATKVSIAPTFVGLGDGCELRVRSVEFDGKELALVLTGYRGKESSLTVPVDQVRWVRFRKALNEEINDQWQAKLRGERSSDLLVVNASNDKLDEASGTILNVKKDRVGFNLGGQQVDAPRSRLEGLVFRGRTLQQERAKAKIIDEAGSTWIAADLSGVGNEIRFKTPTGISRLLKLSAIHDLELMGDAKPFTVSDSAESSFAAFVDGLLDKSYAASLFGPQDTPEGLLLSSGATVTVRLEGEVNFEADVESVAKTYSGAVQLLVQADGETLLEKALQPSDLPMSFKVDVSGKRRLSVGVSTAGDSATGDVLLLRRARLSK